MWGDICQMPAYNWKYAVTVTLKGNDMADLEDPWRYRNRFGRPLNRGPWRYLSTVATKISPERLHEKKLRERI